MMKISGVLGGLLVFFTSTHGFFDISVSCDIYGIEVEVTNWFEMRDPLLEAYELSLGCGCPVSFTDHYIDHDVFLFDYLLNFCGIRVRELPQGILIESSITYAPEELNVTFQIPISCFISWISLPFLDQKNPILVQYGDSAKDFERYYNCRNLTRISQLLRNRTNNAQDHHPSPLSVGYFLNKKFVTLFTYKNNFGGVKGSSGF